MRWRQRYPERSRRPKARRLAASERDEILARLNKAIAASPVLSGLDVRVRVKGSRFYVERPRWAADEEAGEMAILGRITALAEQEKGPLLLESSYRRGWSEVARGSVQTLSNRLAGDSQGTFHGLAALDELLRKARRQGQKPRIKKQGKNKFVDADSGKVCGVPEVLYCYCGVPLPVIAEPLEWYAYHRTPQIQEISRDRQRVLVRFSAMSRSGGSFGGTCLYVGDGGEWGAYTIKPSASHSIATAETWLQRRNWRPWT